MYTPADERNLVLFSGYAKLPSGITASEFSKIIGVIVLINVETSVIAEADCTLATELARRHVARLLVGYPLEQGPDQLIQRVERIYQGNAKKAIITAIRIIYEKYKHFREEGI